ncbi:MAG: phosphoribosylamine--glycine ligase [Methanobacteriaceae archaeon]
MKVLVVGTGAREHAICEALIANNNASNIELYSYMSNKNPGIAKIATYKIGSEMEVENVVEFAKENGIEIAVIGPEAPLEVGIVDKLEEAGIKCVGPKKDPAQIETNKSFMRNLFENHNISGSITYKVFDKFEDIEKFLNSYENDVVVKPIGLTGGKGVKIVGDHLKDNNEAIEYAREVMESKMGGHPKVIIEERVIGEEFTIQAFSDGETIVPMPAAQDHPHAFEGDSGPITGGMGSYSNKGLLPFMNQEDYNEAVKIMEETVKAIAKETAPYKGILYGQFMLSEDGPKLIEYNARFGDPEVMNILPLIKTPMIDVCKAIIDGTLSKVEFEPSASVCKYIVPDGYPETKFANEKIDVDEVAIEKIGAKCFYAAVSQKEDGVYTSSSRALGIVGISNNLSEAEKIAEAACKFVKGNLYHRKDVGTQEIIEKRISNMKSIRTQ